MKSFALLAATGGVVASLLGANTARADSRHHAKRRATSTDGATAPDQSASGPS
jgi:hypothetical protein